MPSRNTRTTDGYQELAVIVAKDGCRWPVADILIGLDHTGDLRVLVSTDENADEHTVAVYPLLERSKAIDVSWGLTKDSVTTDK